MGTDHAVSVEDDPQICIRSKMKRLMLALAPLLTAACGGVLVGGLVVALPIRWSAGVIAFSLPMVGLVTGIVSYVSFRSILRPVTVHRPSNGGDESTTVEEDPVTCRDSRAGRDAVFWPG